MLRRGRPASLRQRCAAASVDGALVGGTFTLIFGRWLRPSGDEDLYARRALVAGVGLGLWLLDQAIAHAAFGRRTIGMAAARIELVTADGRPASLGRYYVRAVAVLLDGLERTAWPRRMTPSRSGRPGPPVPVVAQVDRPHLF